MKLTLRHDYSFKLSIAGYQFPSLTNDEHDSNWLNVRIDVQNPDGNWTAVDPALLTYEVQELAQWLRRLAAEQRDQCHIDFLEPCVSFDVESHASEVLKVTLTYEFRPPWSKSIHDEFQLTFPLATTNLIKAAEDLERDLAKYPQRAAV